MGAGLGDSLGATLGEILDAVDDVVLGKVLERNFEVNPDGTKGAIDETFSFAASGVFIFAGSS